MRQFTAYRTRLVSALGQRLGALDSPFQLWTGHSQYTWPNDVVWHRQRDGLSTFVILGPSRKRAEEFAIYLCWSRLGRFPQTSMRPSILGLGKEVDPTTHTEGSVSLSFAVENFPDWIRWPVSGDVEDTMTTVLNAVMGGGMAFLEKFTGELSN